MDIHLKSTFSIFKTKVLNADALKLELHNKFIEFYKKNDPTNIKKLKRLIPLIIFTIDKNGNVSYDNDIPDDKRVEHILITLKKTIEYCKRLERPIPETKMLFWISDRIPWEFEDDMDKYPFYVYAKPKNTNFILFPDNTFECITLKEKYKGECQDWDSMKELFKEKNKEYKEKQKIIYFKGTPTTKKIHKLREILCEYARTNKNMIVKLDGWYRYQPITETSKYLFLLNLPGHYPWSNRFKFLFLTESVIINVNAYTKSINQDGWNEDEYHSFMDLIMLPDIDFINIEFTYYNAGITDNIKEQETAEDMTKKEVDSVIQQINNIYDDYFVNSSKYNNMIKSYKKKINSLTNESIYDYIYKCIIYNSKIVKG